MLKFIATFLLLAPTVALAQGAPPQPPSPPPMFIPFTVTQSDINTLDMMFMDNPPRVYRQAVQQWISGMEHQAQAAAAAAVSRQKAAEAEKPIPVSPKAIPTIAPPKLPTKSAPPSAKH